MSETKHTPRPWAVWNDCVVSIDCPGRAIARCADYGADGNVANLNLMVTAPELLAACEGLVDWVDPNEAMDGLHRQIDDARAAIAKAKGETP